MIGFFCFAIPLVYWFDAYDLEGWKNYSTPWMNPFTTALVVALCLSLFFFPLCWIATKRVIDSIALALGQQALIFSGYFYLNQTAVHFPAVANGILTISGLVILFNAVGFLFFFLGLALVYGLTKSLDLQLRPLPFPESLLDQRLLRLARLLAVVCAISIAMPMVVTHNVPMFNSDNAVARNELITGNTSRAIFQAGGAILPFVTAILVVGVLRKTSLRGMSRVALWDSALVFAMVFSQFLTADRLPLAITVATTLSAVTMQFRLPRALLALFFVVYLFSFTLLSGFTSLLRLDPSTLEGGDWIGNSVQEAYLGDNIIDLRDGSWVFSQWDFQPLMGRTYLGGALSMIPSGIFPEKKEYHLGMTGVRIVGIPEEEHFGLRMTFFAEAFLNFGWAGVALLGALIGSLYAVVLRQIHLATKPGAHSCLFRNITLLIVLQCLLPLSNTSDAFIFWTQLALLFLIWWTVVRPLRKKNIPIHENESRSPGA